MKIAAFRTHDDPALTRRVGLVLGDEHSWWVHPFPDETDLVALLAADSADRDALADLAAEGDGIRLADVVLLPPVYPVAMRDFVAFEAHVEGMEKGQGNPGVPQEWYEAPVFLFMAPHAVVGAYDDVAYLQGTQRLDFELELAAVIVQDVRNVSPEQAREAIGGYLVMNDWSARDIQGTEMKLKLGPSKGKDFATTIGPWVVTPDELEQYRDADGYLDLAMTVSVNGIRIGGDTSAHMGWTFEQLVSHCSRSSWVKAGEILGSGTCASGSLAESWGRTGQLIPPPLAVGDVVEMTIQGVGTVRNEVVASHEVVPEAPAPRRRTPEPVTS